MAGSLVTTGMSGCDGDVLFAESMCQFGCPVADSAAPEVACCREVLENVCHQFGGAVVLELGQRFVEELALSLELEPVDVAEYGVVIVVVRGQGSRG